MYTHVCIYNYRKCYYAQLFALYIIISTFKVAYRPDGPGVY